MARKLIIHHWDTDGICAAALLMEHELEQGHDVDSMTATLGNYYLEPEEIEDINQEGYEHIIITDISMPVDNIQKLKTQKLSIHDHHIQDIVPGAEHNNPIIKGGDRNLWPSASWIVNSYLDNPMNLLAVLGAIGDHGHNLKSLPIYRQVGEFLDKNDLDFEDLLEATSMIDSSYKVGNKEEVERTVDYMIGYPDIDQILHNEEWKENLKKLDKEIDMMSDIEDASHVGRVIQHEIHTPFNIISTVTRKIAWSNEGKVAVVVNKGFFERKDQMYVRGGDDENMLPIIEAARAKGYNAGGKKEVAGIILPKEDSNAFLDTVTNMLN